MYTQQANLQIFLLKNRGEMKSHHFFFSCEPWAESFISWCCDRGRGERLPAEGAASSGVPQGDLGFICHFPALSSSAVQEMALVCDTLQRAGVLL